MTLPNCGLYVFLVDLQMQIRKVMQRNGFQTTTKAFTHIWLI